MHTLMACLHQTEPEHRVLAANLLLQLDMLVFLLSHIIFFFSKMGQPQPLHQLMHTAFI
jgi:hypothetical protein